MHINKKWLSYQNIIQLFKKQKNKIIITKLKNGQYGYNNSQTGPPSQNVMIDVRRRTVKRRRNEPSIGQTKTTSFKLVHTLLFIYPQNLPSLPVVRELLCVSSRSVRFRTSVIA